MSEMYVAPGARPVAVQVAARGVLEDRRSCRPSTLQLAIDPSPAPMSAADDRDVKVGQTRGASATRLMNAGKLREQVLLQPDRLGRVVNHEQDVEACGVRLNRAARPRPPVPPNPLPPVLATAADARPRRRSRPPAHCRGERERRAGQASTTSWLGRARRQAWQALREALQGGREVVDADAQQLAVGAELRSPTRDADRRIASGAVLSVHECAIDGHGPAGASAVSGFIQWTV